jgi:predicted nucleotidyltransferase
MTSEDNKNQNISSVISGLHTRYRNAIIHAANTLMSSRLSKEIKHIILYGSCARGETCYDSDVDILVVANDEAIKNADVLREFRLIRGDLADGGDVANVDIKLMARSSWDKNDSIYLNSIHREGLYL